MTVPLGLGFAPGPSGASSPPESESQMRSWAVTKEWLE